MTDRPELALRPGGRFHWATLIDRHAHERGDRAALRWQGQTITWAQFADRARAAADALYAEGVRKGDRVALLSLNRPEFIEITVAAQRLGAIVVPINFRLTPPEIAYLLEVSEPRVLVSDEPLLPLAQAAVAAAEVTVSTLITLGDNATGVTAYEDLLAASREPHPPVDVAESDPAFIMFTSGTTGRPKGATLSHLNIQLNGVTCLRVWEAGEDDITLLGTPLFHIAGIGACSGPFLTGSTVVLQPTGVFDPVATLDLLEAEHVTGTFLVPAQWHVLCDELEQRPRTLPLRVLCWGAAPASQALLHRMADCFPGGATVAVFGQSEMSPITCALGHEEALRKIGSVGKPIPFVATRVVDATGQDVPPGQVGEIVYRGPTQMLGYWGRPEATQEAFTDGWFHSGDLVRVDEEGFVYVVDRVKDMLISGGENIYCVEVENALAHHPAISEVNIIGRPHERWGETPVAVAVLRPGSSLTVEELREWADGRIARYKLPTVLEIVDELPRNASGKIVKGRLREQFGGAR